MAMSTTWRDFDLTQRLSKIRRTFEMADVTSVDDVPILANTPCYFAFSTYDKPDDYFADPASMVRYQEEGYQRHLAEINDDVVPYFMPWYGTGVLASAFGCQIAIAAGAGNDPSVVAPCITSAADVTALRMPDPNRDGGMPRVLATIDYARTHECPQIRTWNEINNAAMLAINERLGFDGIVLTKLDGDARGGAALSIRSIVQKPVKFVGTGEKTDALEPFHPDRMASRILGMGDIVTLVEKAQQSFNGEQAVRLQEKLRKSSFTLMDFLEQLREMRKMGPIDQVMAMVPGMSRMQGKANVDERDLVRIEAMILSMTPHERERPAVINGSRRRRIALGSGTTVQHVNRLLKQFDDMQKLMKKFSKGGLRRGMQGFRLPMG